MFTRTLQRLLTPSSATASVYLCRGEEIHSFGGSPNAIRPWAITPGPLVASKDLVGPGS